MKHKSQPPVGKRNFPPTRKLLGYTNEYEINFNKSIDPYASIELRDSLGPSEMNFHVTVPESIVRYVELTRTLSFSEMNLTTGMHRQLWKRLVRP